MTGMRDRITVDVVTSSYDWLMLVVTGLAAAGTIAAVIVALRAIRHERDRATEESARATAAEAERDAERAAVEAERTLNRVAARRAQARLVVAYPMWKTLQEMAGGNEIGYWTIQIGNYSSAPVFEVRVETYMAGARLGPGAKQSTLAPMTPSWIDHENLTNRANAPTALLYFRDVAGVRWRREQSGNLAELDEEGRPIESASP
jgi:hypothetical protein